MYMKTGIEVSSECLIEGFPWIDYDLFEGVWAVHSTVIIAADRREARSELRAALCVRQTGVATFVHTLCFPTVLSPDACACWLSQYGGVVSRSRSGGAMLGR